MVAHEELAKTNEKFVKVNKELASVNKELARINEQVRQHSIMQKEFIHITSHELRTPTQSILGYVELLLLEPQSKFEYGEAIMRNANRLQNVISDILYISKIDNNMLTLNNERFNLTETILQVVGDARNQVIRNSKNVNITYDHSNLKRANGEKEKENDIFIDGDKERIAQVISNILENAIKFVEEGTVTVSVVAGGYTTSSNDDSVVGDIPKETIISIKDSGMGIAPEILPRLFSKFTFKDRTGGTGLGLYICKNTVEAHGGRIWAENNKDGNGATVRFSLPTKQH